MSRSPRDQIWSNRTSFSDISRHQNRYHRERIRSNKLLYILLQNAVKQYEDLHQFAVNGVGSFFLVHCVSHGVWQLSLSSLIKLTSRSLFLFADVAVRPVWPAQQAQSQWAAFIGAAPRRTAEYTRDALQHLMLSLHCLLLTSRHDHQSWAVFKIEMSTLL